MKRANRQFKTIDGILYRLCECGYCNKYVLIGKTSLGTERRFVKGHTSKEHNEKIKASLMRNKNNKASMIHGSQKTLKEEKIMKRKM